MSRIISDAVLVSRPCANCETTANVLEFPIRPTGRGVAMRLCIGCLMELVDRPFATSFRRMVAIGLANRAVGLTIPPRTRPKAGNRGTPDRARIH